jgi:hypothetical protein
MISFSVLCTRSETILGWIDNLYGPTGAVVCLGLGMIQTMHKNRIFLEDVVCCNMVVGTLVALVLHVQEQGR